MSGSWENQGRAATGPHAKLASPVLQDVALAVVLLSYAVGVFVVLSQPLASVPNADELTPPMLADLSR